MKPAPPARRSSSVLSNEHTTPFLPLGSNSTTPRSSMENLPPPPPHLLHSDDDDPPPPPPPAEATPSTIAQRAKSVADSVKALQNSGHIPCSPKSLRRAHSMMGGSPKATPPPPSQEQIYAPVAHLQHKIQQRQQQLHNLEAEYGFGLQFQQSQSQYYQQMVEAGIPMKSPPDQLQQAYGTANHDQVKIKTFFRLFSITFLIHFGYN